jgi:amidase
VVGLKPSRGRVSTGSGSGDAIGLSTAGPLGRSVEDVAALLDVLSASEPGDTDRRGEHRSWLASLVEPLPRLRIGFTTTTAAGAAAHPACRQAVQVAVDLFARAGHIVEAVDNPEPVWFAEAFTTVWATAAALAPLPAGGDDLIRPITRWFRSRGAATSGPDALRALVAVREAGRAVVRATAQLDLLVTPTLAQPPAPVGSLRHDPDPTLELDRIKAFTPFTPIQNASGQPAVSVPLHLDGALPIGVQLVGQPGADHVVLAAARQLERCAGWLDRRPVSW